MQPQPKTGRVLLIPQSKEIMNYSPKQLVAATVLAALGLAAVAQSTPPPGNGPARHERMEQYDPAKMQERRAQRQARMKETLQITAAQEGAWNAWTASMQPPADWKRPDRAELERLTTPERIDRMRAMRLERMARMDQRADATKTFYSSLSPVQKGVFDAETARRWRRGGHEGGHGHHQGQHRS